MGAARYASRAAKEQPSSTFGTRAKTALPLGEEFNSTALSRGERVARGGAFSSRRGSGEGFLDLPSQLVQLEFRIGNSSTLDSSLVADKPAATMPNPASDISSGWRRLVKRHRHSCLCLTEQCINLRHRQECLCYFTSHRVATQNPVGTIQNEASNVFPGARMIKCLNFPSFCRLNASVGPV